MNRETNKGFRFMEFIVILAIVVLIIAAGFSGLRKANGSARNAARAGEVGAYAKAAELHFANARAYPKAADGPRCLGKSSSEDCWVGIFAGDDALLADFKAFISGEPPRGREAGLGKYAGYLYACTDASCQGYSIRYLLEGVDQKCGGDSRLVRAVAFGGFTYCQVIRCAVGMDPRRSDGEMSPYTCQ